MQRDAYYKNYNLYIFFALYYGTVGLIFFLQTSGTKKLKKFYENIKIIGF